MTKNCIKYYIDAWNSKNSLEIFRIITIETHFNLGRFYLFHKSITINDFLQQIERILQMEFIIENYECLNSYTIRLNCFFDNNKQKLKIICKTNKIGGIANIQLEEI